MAIENPIPNFPFAFWKPNNKGMPKRHVAVKFSNARKTYVSTFEEEWYDLSKCFASEAEAWEAGEKALNLRVERLKKQSARLDLERRLFYAARKA